MRAIQGPSGGTKVDPPLLDNVEISHKWSEYLCHLGCSRCTHSILQSGLIAGGKDAKEGRQTVFFTALDPHERWARGSVPNFVGTTTCTLQEHVDNNPGCNQLDVLKKFRIKD